MSTDRIAFITELFSFLDGNISYLWLKAVIDRPEATPDDSDIDLFLRPADLAAVLAFTGTFDRVAKCRILKASHASHLFLTFADGSRLKLDLLTKLVRRQWIYLDEATLFAGRILKNGYSTYHSSLLLEHVLLFNFLNGAGIPSKYIAYFENLEAALQTALLKGINQKYGTDFQSFQEMGKFDSGIRQMIVARLSARPENSRPVRWKRLGRHLLQKWGGYQFFPNRMITFSGVDGAGKTTLLYDLTHILREKYDKKVIVLRHRPSLLPILSAWKYGKTKAENRASHTLPHEGRNSSRAGSLLRFGYYLSDYLIGQCYIWVRYLIPGYTVIYDRYYFDFMADAKRSNLVLNEKLPRMLYRFIYKPRLNFFLYADPAVIRSRKKELSETEIIQMTDRYRSLFHSFSVNAAERYHCIRNNDRAATLQTLFTHLTKTW